MGKLALNHSRFAYSQFTILARFDKKDYFQPWPEAVVQRCSIKKVVLKILAKFTRKHLCRSLSLIKL